MALEDIRLGIFDHSGVISDDRPPVYEANMVLLERFGLSRISFEDWLLASKASAGDWLLSHGVTVPKAEVNAQPEECDKATVQSGWQPNPGRIERRE